MKSSYFVAVEKREVGRASEFADTYTEPAKNEIYHRFYNDYELCVGLIWAINLVCLALCSKV
jgi:hypothetical protein